MQNGELARSTQRLIRMLRPETCRDRRASGDHLVQANAAGLPESSGRAAANRPAHAGTARRARGAARDRQARRQARAEAALPRVLPATARAIADAATLLARRDKDAFDRICDHLLVIDHAARPSMSGRQPVVGTYRLLRQEVAESHGGFYTEERIRHRRPDRPSRRPALSRTRPLLRAAALSQQAHRRTAVARDLDLCPPAPARRHDRLRQLRGHRSRAAGAAAVVPASLRAGPGSLARTARIPPAGSR